MIYSLEKKISINSIVSYLEINNETYLGVRDGFVRHIGFPDYKTKKTIMCFANDEIKMQALLKRLQSFAIIFTTEELFSNHQATILQNFGCIVTGDPRNSFANILDLIISKKNITPLKSRKPLIDKSSRIGKYTTVNTEVEIGKNVQIGPNCSIGEKGFGFYIDRDGLKKRFPHFGKVIICENVEIDSNVSVDRGAFSDTIIGENTKIGSLVHIAHNSKIESNVVIAPQSKLCGSVLIGKGVYIAPAVVIRQSVKIGEGSIIGMGSVVTKDVPPYSMVYGNPARVANSIDKLNQLPV